MSTDDQMKAIDFGSSSLTAHGKDFAGRRSVRVGIGLVVIAIIASTILILPTFARHSSAGLGPLESRAPALNQAAPDFALKSTDGQTVRLSDLRGHIVLVNFWATWCTPCRAELPAIEQAYRHFKGQGLQVLEVNDGEAPGTVAAFTKQIGAMPPVLLDQGGTVVAQYALKGLPDSFFIDRQGNVRAVSYGPMSSQTILKDIELTRQAAP